MMMQPKAGNMVILTTYSSLKSRQLVRGIVIRSLQTYLRQKRSNFLL